MNKVTPAQVAEVLTEAGVDFPNYLPTLVSDYANEHREADILRAYEQFSTEMAWSVHESSTESDLTRQEVEQHFGVYISSQDERENEEQPDLVDEDSPFTQEELEQMTNEIAWSHTPVHKMNGKDAVVYNDVRYHGEGHFSSS